MLTRALTGFSYSSTRLSRGLFSLFSLALLSCVDFKNWIIHLLRTYTVKQMAVQTADASAKKGKRATSHFGNI